jgi:hypothetical protein
MVKVIPLLLVQLASSLQTIFTLFRINALNALASTMNRNARLCARLIAASRILHMLRIKILCSKEKNILTVWVDKLLSKIFFTGGSFRPLFFVQKRSGTLQNAPEYSKIFPKTIQNSPDFCRLNSISFHHPCLILCYSFKINF